MDAYAVPQRRQCNPAHRPLENGTYLFEAKALDHTIPYEVEVSGLPVASQEITSVALTGLDVSIAGQLLDTAVAVETVGVTVSTVAC